MKRILFLLVATVIGQWSIAQEKAPAATELNKTGTSATEYKKHHKMDKHEKKMMMKELNLSADQKAKLKEMKEVNKAKKEAILNDSKLTEEQKHEQLKALHQSGAKNMQSILTDEQKQKMKEIKARRKAERKNHPGTKTEKTATAAGSQEIKAGTQNK